MLQPIVAIILCITVYIVSLIAVTNTGRNFYAKQESPKIHDSLHNILPDMYHLKLYKDLYILLLVIPLMLYSGDKFEIIKEILGFFIPITMLRSIRTYSTILPKTDERCNSDGHINLFGQCHDHFFSNHTAFVLLVTLIYADHGLIDMTQLGIFNFINMFLIIATKSHYTVDVIFAIFVVVSMYQNNIRVF